MNDRHDKRYMQVLQPLLKVVDADSLKGVLQGTGIGYRDLHNPGKTFSRSQELALYRQVAERPENSGLGFIVGHAFTLGVLGPVGYAQAVCRTARQAIELGKRYRRLTIPATHWDVLVVDNELVYRIFDTGDLSSLRAFMIDLSLAFFKQQTEELMGAECRPVRLRFSCEDPGNSEHYFEWFGIKPEFRQGCTELRFPAALLDRERRGHDPAMLSVMEPLCERMASSSSQDPMMELNVLDLLRASADTLPCARETARRLFISPRTMRRHLSENKSNYRMLVDKVRQERAVEHLRDCEMAIAVVAERCGYSEVHSFCNAFKRWTGQTPVTYRAQFAI